MPLTLSDPVVALVETLEQVNVVFIWLTYQLCFKIIHVLFLEKNW